MCHQCWKFIYVLVVLVTEIEPNKQKVKTSCPVGDLKPACSSSNSVNFEWTLKTKWTGTCKNQIMKINYFIPGTTSRYTQVDILDKEITISGLQKDKKYVFKFVHYMNHNNDLNQVQNGFKIKEAVPREVGRVKNLTVTSIEATSATVSWSSARGTNCISNYILKWCSFNNHREECQQSSVANSVKHHTLLNLTPCTLYSLSVSAVDIDNAVSSPANLTFNTASEVADTVTDLTIRRATPHSLVVSWSSQSCAPFNISVSSLRGLLHSDTTLSTSYTFDNLQPCTLHQVSVSPAEGEWIEYNVQVVRAYTSIISNATVTSLTASQVTDHSVVVSWHLPAVSLPCLSGYQVLVSSRDNLLQTKMTSMTFTVITDLEPCTLYRVAVTAVFSNDTLSMESVTVDAQTNAPARILNQRVEDVSVTEQTADSLVVTWTQPIGSECLRGYRTFLYDSDYKTIYNQSVPADRKSFTFRNLKQCKLHYVYIVADFGNFPYDDRIQFRRMNLTETFTLAKDEVVVTNLAIKTSWDSLQLDWSPPLGYEVCTRHYEVRVCSGEKCEGPVSLDTTSYLLNNLPACTSYSVEVRAESSPALSLIAGNTVGTNAVLFDQFEVINKTSESITFRWAVTEAFQGCKGRFFVSLWDSNSFVEQMITNKTLDYSIKEYTAESLKPCHSYSLKVRLIDFAEKPIFVYTPVKSTTKGAGDQKIKDPVAIPYDSGITLAWSVDPTSSACVTHFHVLWKSRDGSSTAYNTTDSTFRWTGDPCKVEFVTVQPASEDELIGQPVFIFLQKQFEDLSKLSIRVINVGAREATVQLVSAGFLCFSEYTISWHRVTNHTDVANLTSVANQVVTLKQLEPCATYSVKAAPRNGDKIGAISTTVTTLYAEPDLVADIRSIPRGFNLSWHLRSQDTKNCLSHVEVNVQNNNYNEKEKVFADSYLIGALIPCQQYLITLEGFGGNGKSRMFYWKLNDVSPEVLPVPDKATLVNVTRNSAVLDWDVGTTDNNSCEPSDLKVDCRPSVDINVYSAGWSPARVRLDRLRPYTRYDCELVVVNKAGPSNGTHVSFVTSEGEPTRPRNVVVASSSSEVSVSWEPPDQVPGVLTSYAVLVYNQSLLYPPSPACPPPTVGPRQLVVGANVTQAVVGGLSPATSLWVTVSAATSAGYGPPSDPVASTTWVGGSDPVEDLNVTIVRSTVLLSWRRPCLTNGPIDHFSIKLNGTRPNHHAAFYATNITTQQSLENYSTSLNVSLLTAEAIYSAFVVPIGSNGLPGQYNPKNFTVPSRIPMPPSDQVFAELPLVRTTRSTATISIRSDLFPDTAGTIRYYAIIVASNFSYEPRYGLIRNNSWPTMKNWAAAMQSRPTGAYQATQPWWEPFIDTDTTPFAIKQFTLGTEECSKTDLTTFCNGPLQPGNSYSVRIRGFTRSGFRDSASITFQTVDPIVEAYLIILTLLILAVVTTTAFIYLVVKGHIQWSKEKKRVGNTFKTEEKPPVVCERLPLVEFIDHVENIVTSKSLLEEEYNQVALLTVQLYGTANIARLPHNVSKNRYKNIIPYDSNLVKLEGDEVDSYINASHIQFQGKKSRQYIACQAPKGETCEDFWRMVLQYKVNTIVMLCLLCEKDKIKCSPYFPTDLEKVVNFSGFNIYCTREEVFTSYIVRDLTIDKEGTQTKVKHFHFCQWLDHNVPKEPQLLVDFVEALRRTNKHKHNPMVVHCSAGVGRTGTFIVVDELLRKIHNCWRCRLSVPDTVLQLRKQRHHLMVQTQEQYCYIYRCLKYALEHHSTFTERVRNSAVTRSKVDLGEKEVIQMQTTLQARETTSESNQLAC